MICKRGFVSIAYVFVGPIKTYNNGRQGRGRKPVQSRGEDIKSQKDEASREQSVEGTLDTTLRCDGGTGHGATDGHRAEEAVGDVDDTEVVQLLALVDLVVVLPSESLADGQVLESAGHKRCHGPRRHLRNKT